MFSNLIWQIEEPIGILEETTANDVTDYADWSTFDGGILVSYMHDYTVDVVLIFYVLFQQHKVRAACIPRSRTIPMSALHQTLLPLHHHKILQLLEKMEHKNIQLSTSPLKPVTQWQYMQVQSQTVLSNYHLIVSSDTHTYLYL